MAARGRGRCIAAVGRAAIEAVEESMAACILSMAFRDSWRERRVRCEGGLASDEPAPGMYQYLHRARDARSILSLSARVIGCTSIAQQHRSSWRAASRVVRESISSRP